MSESEQSRYLVDPYMEWVQSEGVPIVEEYALNLFDVKTGPWPRFGVKGAAVHLKGRGDFCSMFVLEMEPGKATSPQRHLFEEVVYVLEGAGNTQIEFADGRTISFEWGQHSMFAIPANAKYRHFNASGRERALMVSTTNLPLLLKTFVDPNFLFNCDYEFVRRMGKEEHYAGQGEFSQIKMGWVWETNFVADLNAMELRAAGRRGAGSATLTFQLGDSTMHTHVSEMPPGTYKKAHRHRPGTHVMFIQGKGYSLHWFEGEEDYLKIEWKYGVVFPPAYLQFHQHFNTSDKPARYFATAVGNARYPLQDETRRAHGGDMNSGEKATLETSTKEGGHQIEYEDQDPKIHQIWIDELKKNGLAPMMDHLGRPVESAKREALAVG